MKIVIQGKPIPKARARTFMRGDRSITYDPQKAEMEQVKHELQFAIRSAYFSENEEIAKEAFYLTKAKEFHLDVCFVIPTNDSDSEGQKNEKLWGLVPCNKKPDLSNMLKFYEDCANEVLYKDDSMITSCTMKKIFDENGRTEIEIMSKKELSLDDRVKGILKSFSPNQLQEFISDAGWISRIDLREMAEMDGEDREVWLTSVACLLSCFSIKYSELLKKIRKFDGLTETVEEIIKFSEDSSDEQFKVGKPLC